MPESKLFSERAARVRNHLLQTIRPVPRDKLLDIGGGEGDLAESLAQYYSDVFVLEPNMKKVKKGKQKNSTTNFVPGAAESLPFSNGSFGTVFAIASFHHFSDQHLALEEVHRVLRSSGTAVVYDFDQAGWLGRIMGFVENRLLGGNTHFRKRPELEAMLRKHSLKASSSELLTPGFIIVATKDE